MDPNAWYILDDETRIHRSDLPLYDLAIAKPNPTMTVVAVTDDYKVSGYAEAIKRIAAAIPFGVEKLLVSLDQPKEFSGRWIKLPKRFEDKVAFSRYMIRSLPDLIGTDFCLTVQSDDFATDPSAWSSDFLKYDYIGTPLVRHPVLKFLLPRFVRHHGNSAFSLRSSRWLLLSKRADPFTTGAEDMFYCRNAAKLWIRNGCRVAPVKIALRFNTEWAVSNLNYEQSIHNHTYSSDGQKRPAEWPSYTKTLFQLGRRFFEAK